MALKVMGEDFFYRWTKADIAPTCILKPTLILQKETDRSPKIKEPTYGFA
jgi:hypothetical protein